MVSLLVPALAVYTKPLFGSGGREELMLGIQCLAIGFFLLPGWVANPLIFIAWLVLALARGRAGHFAVARWLGVLATISAVSAPFLLVSPGLIQLRYPHVGYFLWLASIVLTVVEAHRGKLDADDAAVT